MWIWPGIAKNREFRDKKCESAQEFMAWLPARSLRKWIKRKGSLGLLGENNLGEKSVNLCRNCKKSQIQGQKVWICAGIAKNREFRGKKCESAQELMTWVPARSLRKWFKCKGSLGLLGEYNSVSKCVNHDTNGKKSRIQGQKVWITTRIYGKALSEEASGNVANARVNKTFSWRI